MNRMSLEKVRLQAWLFWVGLTLLYVVVHLPGLTALPIFADEAIYIRWAQLIITDWDRYVLFPLNDGKTPFFIWLLIPFLKLLGDPLWAGRLLSVIGGWLQLLLVVVLLKELKVHRVGQLIGALIVIFAPFWFFHHRMVLMDGWMTVWLSVATFAVLKVSATVEIRHRVLWLSLGGLAIWAGMMTKVPFILTLPALFLLPLRLDATSAVYLRSYKNVGIQMLIGLGLFSLLLFSPIFPQLLTRGGDFLLPISAVLSGHWQETLPSVPTYLGYFFNYVGWGVILLAIISLVLPGKRRIGLILGCSFLLFSLPIWLLGRVVYPRYLFPTMLYVTLMAGLGAGTLWQWSNQAVQTKRRQFAIRTLVLLLALHMILTSMKFVLPSWTEPDKIPFVSADQSQYLTTWSSGHGLVQSMSYFESIQPSADGGKLLVATEGNFGSLPDGLLLYNFNRPLTNVWIEGIGYPVDTITPEFYAKIQPYDRVVLVVNSDRLRWQLDQQDLLKQFCRPHAGSCLQIWDITETYTKFKKN